MLNRFDFTVKDEGGCYSIMPYRSGDGDWVRHVDATSLIAQKDLRIRELEQQLMTEAEKRAAFEEDLHLDQVGAP